MPARISAILPPLARNREFLEGVYEALVTVGAKHEIPCSAVDAFKTARAKTMRLETLIVQAARVGVQMKDKSGAVTTVQLHPPDVPRSLPIFGACPAGAEEIRLSKDNVKSGAMHAKSVRQRAEKTDEALIKLYKEDASVRSTFDAYLLGLAPLARQGTPEEAPAPANIGLLRLMFYLGGALWPLGEADKLQASTTEVVTEEEAARVYGETLALARATHDLVSSTGADEPIMSNRGWAYLIGGAVTAAVAAGSAAWFLTRPKERQHDRGYSGDAINTTATEIDDHHALPAYEGG